MISKMDEENDIDVYDERGASDLLDDDEVSASEEGFMLGYDADFEE